MRPSAARGPCNRQPSSAQCNSAFRLTASALCSGEAPKSEKILPEFDLGHACKAELDCTAVVDRLDNSTHKLTLSDDPGRFVCNFMAFSSMKRAAALNASGAAPKRLAVFW